MMWMPNWPYFISIPTISCLTNFDKYILCGGVEGGLYVF